MILLAKDQDLHLPLTDFVVESERMKHLAGDVLGGEGRDVTCWKGGSASLQGLK